MKINILPASKMRDVDNVCFSGSNYVIKRRYHIAYRYTFKGRTHEEAKASLLAKDGLFGFNTTHNSRPNGFFTPKSPDNIILDFGENHEIRPKDEATAQCVLYFSNSPQHTAILDNFSDIRIDGKNDDNGCTLETSFNADFYVTLPDCFADPLYIFDGYKKQNIPPAAEWIEKNLEGNLKCNIKNDPDISYLYSVPYTYPGREKFWPWQEAEPEDVQLEILEATPLEEGVATCFYDEDIVTEYQNNSKSSIMR